MARLFIETQQKITEDLLQMTTKLSAKVNELELLNRDLQSNLDSSMQELSYYKSILKSIPGFPGHRPGPNNREEQNDQFQWHNNAYKHC